MCWKCGADIIEENISRSSTCTCGAEIRCCRNCEFFSPGSHYDCKETVDELVKEKESGNFCDSFRVKRTCHGKSSGSSAVDKAAEARKAFEALFG